jgi:glyoxylase-like metal-dependent hydrolase (beta-lactamase superfamily II)
MAKPGRDANGRGRVPPARTDTMADKAFASQADLVEKKVSFDKLSGHAYAYTAEGDPNTGIVVGDDAVMVIDTQATPVMAQDVIRRIREVTAKPIRYVVLSHYHAVRVLGASGYKPEHVIASRDTYDLIVERGAQDMQSEIERFPRLFRAVESVPGLTWPTLVFEGSMTLWLGKLRVDILQLGRGHTKGDTVVWLPQDKVLFSGDLVEFGATPYTGDAYLKDWPATLDRVAALGAEKLVPGRGASLTTPADVKAGLDGTRAFITAMFESVRRGAAAGKDLRTVYRETYAALKPRFGDWVIFDHCLPFDVTRAYDEATAHADPRIWTAQRDKEMWQSLES